MKHDFKALNDLLRHWVPIPREMEDEFNTHVRLTNARRLSIIFSALAVSISFLAAFHGAMILIFDAAFTYELFFITDIVIVSTTLILLLIHQNINAEKQKTAHALLKGVTVYSLTGLLSVAAGIEFFNDGGTTTFYLTMFGLCTTLILPPALLIPSFLWAILCLLTTVWVMEGSLSPFLLENIHLIGLLLLVGGVVSRTVATTFTRDFLLIREVEHSNRQLRREVHKREKIMRRMAGSERELNNIFEYAPDPYILSDTSGKIIRINRAAVELIGRPMEEILNKGPGEVGFLGGGTNIAQVKRMLHETSICGRSGPCELQEVVFQDDRIAHLELHASLFHLEDREMVLTIFRDITTRKEGEALLKESRNRLEERVKERTKELERMNRRLKDEITERIATEAALAKAETHYRLLVESMNEGLAIFDADERFIYTNDYFCAMTGYDREAIMGRKNSYVVAREDHSMLQAHVRRRQQGNSSAYETRVVKISGEIVHIRVSPKPMFDDNGAYKGSFIVVTNITDLKMMEAALRKSEERARALLNASSDAAMLATPSGILLEANENACQFLESPRAEVVGRSIFNSFPGIIPSHHTNIFQRAINKGEIQRFEDQVAGRRHFDITMHPIAHQGRVDRVALFARDITELKAAEKHIRALSQELIKTQENERQRIARDLHDNVAQNLATLKIGWDTLLDTATDEPPAFHEKTRALSRLLRDSIESIRGLAYNLQPPELEQLGLISAISRHCEDQAAHFGLSIDLFTAGVKELPLTFDTQINLYRLVQEALSNVNKHADATLVTIRMTASHPNLILTVEDNGKGFNIQKRLTEAIKEKRMGVRSMEERVSLLHGTMKLVSSPGMGTRLRIEVPAGGEVARSKVA